MNRIVLSFILFFSFSISAKEWKSLNQFKKLTFKEYLSASDWLTSDRKNKTVVWQNANIYNLQNNLPKEYITIKERRDFYSWFNSVIQQKGHEVVWPKMAKFISKKLNLVHTFPINIFIKKSIKKYAYAGSELVFNKVFLDLRSLYNSNKIYKNQHALNWDSNVLYKEQYYWLESIYAKIDSKSLKSIQKIAKGKSIFGLFVPKEIRFNGKIKNPNDRYTYALKKLRYYCKD